MDGVIDGVVVSEGFEEALVDGNAFVVCVLEDGWAEEAFVNDD